jgi:hypothetical protein
MSDRAAAAHSSAVNAVHGLHATNGLENAHPWLKGLNEEFGPLGGWVTPSNSLRDNRPAEEQVLLRLRTEGVKVVAALVWWSRRHEPRA